MKTLIIKDNGTVTMVNGIATVHCPYTLGNCSAHCAWCTIKDGKVWCKEWAIGVIEKKK